MSRLTKYTGHIKKKNNLDICSQSKWDPPTSLFLKFFSTIRRYHSFP